MLLALFLMIAAFVQGAEIKTFPVTCQAVSNYIEDAHSLKGTLAAVPSPGASTFTWTFWSKAHDVKTVYTLRGTAAHVAFRPDYCVVDILVSGGVDPHRSERIELFLMQAKLRR